MDDGKIKARKELSAIIADKDATIAADKTTIANLITKVSAIFSSINA